MVVGCGYDGGVVIRMTVVVVIIVFVVMVGLW